MSPGWSVLVLTVYSMTHALVEIENVYSSEERWTIMIGVYTPTSLRKGSSVELPALPVCPK